MLRALPSASRQSDWGTVFLLALAIRVVFCASYYRGSYPFADRYREYIITAQRLIDHGAYVSPFESESNPARPSALMPPLYTFWVAGVFTVLGGERLSARILLELANALASALAGGVAFKVAARLAGSKAAWITGLICAFHPALVGYTNYVWDTSFFVLAVIVSVWISLRLSELPVRNIQYLAMGLWLGMVALLNPALTLAYPLLVLFPLRRRAMLGKEKMITAVALSILGWALVIMPWTIRNYVRLGSIQYVRSGLMLEFWMGVSPEVDRQGSESYLRHFPLKNPEVAEYVSQVGENQYLKELGEKVGHAIAQNPGRYAKLVLWRAADFWLGTVMTHGGPDGWVIPATGQRRLLMVVFCLEVLLVAWALVRGRLGQAQDWWLLAIMLFFCLIYLLTNVQVRFRVPIEPIFAVLLGVVLSGAKRQMD